VVAVIGGLAVLGAIGIAVAFGLQKDDTDSATPPVVLPAGHQFTPPGMMVVNGYASSPCGGSSGRGVSFYCPSNHTIYMDAADDMDFFRQNQPFGRLAATHTVAHEYGHALQGMTGIIRSYNRLYYDAPNRAARLEVNRRMELQASCFGNLFLGANKGSYPIRGQFLTLWDYFVSNGSDPRRDHGSARNHSYWSKRGFGSRNLAACNTFTAPASRVS
jgi:predicted metalloprotease